MMDAAVRAELVTSLLAQLVAVPSVTPRDSAPSEAAPGEAAVARFVITWLAERGVAARLTEVLPGRPNVIATVPGRSERSILLETHLDTVEVAGMVEPFSGRVEGGRLHGRGATDAKGSLAAFMVALVELAAAPEPPAFTVTLAAVADEEHRYRGVLALLEQGDVDPANVVGALVGEPTELRAGIAHTGCVRFTVHVTGQSGHSSRPHEAVNAVALAADVVRTLEGDEGTWAAHPLLGRGTRTVTRIHAGEAPNIVPGACELDVDRRTLPGEEPDAVLDDVRRLLEPVAPGRVRIDEPFLLDYPLDTPVDSAIVAAVGTALAAIGLPAEPIGMPFATDGSKLGRVGIPTVVIGPGTIADAHTVDESIALSQLTDAVEVVLATVRAMEGIAS